NRPAKRGHPSPLRFSIPGAGRGAGWTMRVGWLGRGVDMENRSGLGCSPELDAGGGDDLLQAALDDLGLGVAQDDEALAVVGAGGDLPDARELLLDDQRAELALQ